MRATSWLCARHATQGSIPSVATGGKMVEVNTPPPYGVIYLYSIWLYNGQVQ